MAILTLLTFLYALFILSMSAEPNLMKRATCDPGWISHGNRCFRYFSSAKSWSEAEGTCAKSGGHLASIHSSEVSHFVGKLSTNKQWTWIGGMGSSLGFSWSWTDGSPFDYSNWKQWEPNNHGGNEHCVSINSGGSDGVGVWNDFPCHASRPFVCAK